MKNTLQNYTPTPDQARWLRKWDATGLVFQGAASVRTSADFEAAKARNIQHFTDWTAATLAQLCGDAVNAQASTENAPPAEKRKRRTKEEMAADAVAITETPQADADNDNSDSGNDNDNDNDHEL